MGGPIYRSEGATRYGRSTRPIGIRTPANRRGARPPSTYIAPAFAVQVDATRDWAVRRVDAPRVAPGQFAAARDRRDPSTPCAMTDDLPPADPIRRSYVMPPSTLTRADWVAVYGEEVMRWHGLTPEERWRESMARWVALMASGARLDDDSDVEFQEELDDEQADPILPPPAPDAT